MLINYNLSFIYKIFDNSFLYVIGALCAITYISKKNIITCNNIDICIKKK